MNVQQPIVRGALAIAVLGGALAATPSTLTAHAQRVSLRPSVTMARPRHAALVTSVPHASATSPVSTTGAVTLLPPAASHAPRRLHAQRAQFFTPRHLFTLGLAAPMHDLALAPAGQAAGDTPTYTASALPSSVDLSADAPPVGDQGAVNSCASWATGYTLLGWYAHHYGVAGAPYAPMYVYAQLVHGVNTGTSIAGNFAIEQQGIDTQADYTQGNYDYTSQPTAAEQANAAHYHITGYTQIYQQGLGNAQQAIESAMAAGQPVVVGIPVYGNFMNATASAPFVDVPPAGSPLYGGHAIVAMKYDANGLWIQNQWRTSWGLNGWAELSWAFVNQYMYEADTISGFQGPSATVATASPSAATTSAPVAPSATASPAPSTTPSGTARLWVSPASGVAGSRLTINGSGFLSSYVTVFWNGNAIAQVATSGGGFSLAETLATTALPGPRTIVASDAASGQQVTTTFTVLSASPAASATAKPASPTATATAAPPSPTAPATSRPASPTATSTATPVPPTATSTATRPSTSAALTLNPSSGVPGSALTMAGTGFHASENVTLSWNGNPLVTVVSSSAGTFTYQVTLAQSAAPGTRSVGAAGAGGDSAGATFTVLGSAAPTATPSSTAPAGPTATPTQPIASPTPPSGIPTSGTTSNGCQITPDSGQAEAQLLALLNQHRAAAGVPPLTLNASLSVVSRTHSCDMFLHQQLNHNGSDGSTPFSRMAAGGFGTPPYSQEGENIGMAGGYATSNAVSVIDGNMMAEPLTYGDHHWNIVNAGYKIVGVGVIAANGQTWLTEDFAG